MFALTQALIAEQLQKDVRTINEHVVNIVGEGELSREATIRELRMVRADGKAREEAVTRFRARRATTSKMETVRDQALVATP